MEGRLFRAAIAIPQTRMRFSAGAEARGLASPISRGLFGFAQGRHEWPLFHPAGAIAGFPPPFEKRKGWGNLHGSAGKGKKGMPRVRFSGRHASIDSTSHQAD